MQISVKVIPEKIIGVKTPQTSNKFTQNQAILYALAIGFSQDPQRQEDLKYTYEMHQDFIPFPLMATIINKFDLFTPFCTNPNFPEFNPFHTLQGEQRLQLIQPKIFPGKQYFHQQQVVDIIDKGKYTICVMRIDSYVKNNQNLKQLAFVNHMALIIRGMGGFGYKGAGALKALPMIPSRKPDIILKSQSYSNQALLYRLTNDINPLHVDPNIAALQNYERPIMHGMASFGNVCRVIVQQILENKPQKVKAYQGRFVGHVFPGQTYIIKLWKQEATLVFQVYVGQRDKKCIIGLLQLAEEAKI